MDPRSLALLEFPLVRARLAEATSFPPSRRLAEALEPSSDPVIVARGLDETDQTRALLAERPGVGVGAARDIGPAIERAARAGRLEPAQFLEIADTLDATVRLVAVLADERRALLRDLAGDLHTLPALRSTLARSFDPVGELLDTASPRLGGLRASVRVAYDRLRRRLDALGRRGAGIRAAGTDHHAPQRPVRRARQGRGPLQGQGHRPRRLGQRPDPVHRAARRRGARERLARGPGRRGRGSRADPRRAVGLRGGERGAAARDPGRARAVRLLGRQGEPRGRHGRRPGRDVIRRRWWSCSRRGTRA